MSLSKDPALGRLILAWIPAFAGMTWVGNFLNYPFVLSSVEACISHGSDPRVWLTPEWVVRQAHHDRYLGIGGLNKIGLVSEQLVYFPLSLFFSAAAGALDGLVEARAVFTDADDHWQRQCVAEYQGLLFGFQAGEH